MGATSTHKDRTQSIGDFIAERLNPGMEIIASRAMRNPDHYRGGEWSYHFYAAVRVGEGQENAGEVFALVVLYRPAPNSYYNLTYKVLDETVGPTAQHAPASVLDLLTPTEHEYAVKWREACRANLARKSLAATR